MGSTAIPLLPLAVGDADMGPAHGLAASPATDTVVGRGPVCLRWRYGAWMSERGHQHQHQHQHQHDHEHEYEQQKEQEQQRQCARGAKQRANGDDADRAVALTGSGHTSARFTMQQQEWGLRGGRPRTMCVDMPLVWVRPGRTGKTRRKSSIPQRHETAVAVGSSLVECKQP